MLYPVELRGEMPQLSAYIASRTTLKRKTVPLPRTVGPELYRWRHTEVAGNCRSPRRKDQMAIAPVIKPHTLPATMLLGASLALSACGLFSGKSDTPAVEVNIMPQNHRANLRDFLEKNLTDPYGVRDAYITEPRIQPIGSEPRYAVCLRYNAKDGYGQYVGSRDHIAIYFAGKLNQLVPATPEQCANASYQRFPELEALKRPG
jgi:hypothetical protein